MDNTRLYHGKIPKGYTCPYTNKCGDFKIMCCNGAGCPVSDGKITSNDFSCAMARGLDIIETSK